MQMVQDGFFDDDAIASGADKNRPLSEKYRRKVSEFIENNIGIQLPQNKTTLIESRLKKRQRILGLSSLEEYIDYALADEPNNQEKTNLVDSITTNKTDFYREPKHFEFITSKIIEKLRQKQLWTSLNPLRIWSAGCSSGEEPYTIAIELLEIKRQFQYFDFEIIATDISSRCLNTARKGIYPLDRISPITIEKRKRYLYKSIDPEARMAAVSNELMKRVSFREFNLITGLYDKKDYFDVVFCRNVMIYFKNEDREKISRRIHSTLKPGGFFIIGHSETLATYHDIYNRVVPTIYKKIIPKRNSHD